MLAYGVNLDLFIKQFINLLNTIIVKRNERAAIFETLETRKEADKYIAMIETGTNWEAFSMFSIEAMRAVGLSDTVIDSVLSGDKEAVPYELRELLCKTEKEYILSSYIEKNNYYRWLHGDPSIEDTEKDFVYLPEGNPMGISHTVPVHLLSDNEKEYLNTSPMLDELKAQYPDKFYLWYLGSNSISYYKSRTAKNYEILKIGRTENVSIVNDFIRNYAACRNYVMIGLYNKEDQFMYEHYDSFMGMLILVMAIQKTFTTIFKQGITRDFYDDNLIRSLYETYNIPYIESIDIKHHKELAKKLNVLLQKKSTNDVLVDIASLFNFKGVNIYKYYLVKDFYKDDNGDPVIIYKDVVDEDGNVHSVIDYEKSYNIYFQKVNIASKDPAVEINDDSNRVPYSTLTQDDPYWIEDSELITKIYTSKFNHILTKYMSIDVSYDLATLTYETAYCFRMIINDQKDFKMLYITLPFVTEPVSLFDAVLFVSALVAKKYNLAGNVPLDTYKIAQVYGFNFTTDIDDLKERILNDIESCTGEYKKVHEDIFQYLTSFRANTLAGARELFNDIVKLKNYLDNAMRYTNDPEAYYAYRKLYNALLVSEDTKELYTKIDGTYADSFLDLLENRRPDLAEVVHNTRAPYDTSVDEEESEPFAINTRINKTLTALSELSDNLSEIKYANDKSEVVVNIEKVINQMKSYTVDQASSGITYVLRDPHFNLLKIMDAVTFFSSSPGFDSYLHILYDDLIHLIEVKMVYKDNIHYQEIYFNYITEILKDVIHIYDEIHSVDKVSELRDHSYVVDAISHGFIELMLKSNIPLIENVRNIKVTEVIKDILHINSFDIYEKIVEEYQNDGFEFFDSLTTDKRYIVLGFLLSFMHKLSSYAKIYFIDRIKFNDKISREIKEDFKYQIETIDTITAYMNTNQVTKVNISSMLFAHRSIKNKDDFDISDKINFIVVDDFANKEIGIMDTLSHITKEFTIRKIITEEGYKKSVSDLGIKDTLVVNKHVAPFNLENNLVTVKDKLIKIEL